MITTTLIYTLTAFAIGTFVGMVLELIVDNSLIKNLEDENEHLKIKLEDAETHEVIEINDHRTKDNDYELPHYEDVVDFSQKW